MNGARRRFCDTPMGQVHVLEAGPDVGAPIVLLHQTPRSMDEFAELIPRLAAERPVIAIDTPGYGCSDPVAGQPTVADYAGAVVCVLDGLGAGRAVFAGHHTGAVIALELAAAHPEHVERLVLSGPVFVDETGRAGLARHFQQWTTRPDGSHLLEKWDKFMGWTKQPALVQRIVADLFRAGERSEQGHFAVAGYRMEDRLPLLRCPGLLVYWSGDSFTDPQRARPIREALRPAREVFLEGGVFGANENPGALAAAILDYVRG